MIEILYRKNGLIACQKPVGVCAQATEAGDGLPQLLEAQLGHTVYPLHRLDQGVGGVMLLCEHADRVGKYTELLQSGILQKRYLAVVSTPPALASDTLCDLLFHDVKKNRTYVVDRPRKGVKDASLSYTVLAQQEDGHTLLLITLHTGRTHQIRAQFASRKLPLCGDGKYGSREKCPIALWSLSFDSTDENRSKLHVRAAVPKGVPWDGFGNLGTYF
jgi:23S rRNA pseudouridine1911/1915/1917 synthase